MSDATCLLARVSVMAHSGPAVGRVYGEQASRVGLGTLCAQGGATAVTLLPAFKDWRFHFINFLFIYF